MNDPMSNRLGIKLSSHCHRCVITPQRLVEIVLPVLKRRRMIVLVHDVPGRLRLVAPHLKRKHRAAAALRRQVRSVEGVTCVSVSPITGSVIVHHDGSAVTRARILASLEAEDPRSAAPDPVRPVPPPPLVPRGDAVADMIANAVAERLVERAVRMMVATLI